MMNSNYQVAIDHDGKSIWKFLISELKPKGKWVTPFNRMIRYRSFRSATTVGLPIL